MRVLVTEEQLRLIKENDGYSYDTLAQMLFNKEYSELALGLIKSQDINVEALVDEIMKNELKITSDESLMEFIKKIFYKGQTFAIFLNIEGTFGTRSGFHITPAFNKPTSANNNPYHIKWLENESPDVKLTIAVHHNDFVKKSFTFEYNTLRYRLSEIYEAIKNVWIELITKIKMDNES